MVHRLGARPGGAATVAAGLKILFDAVEHRGAGAAEAPKLDGMKLVAYDFGEIRLVAERNRLVGPMGQRKSGRTAQ